MTPEGPSIEDLMRAEIMGMGDRAGREIDSLQNLKLYKQHRGPERMTFPLKDHDPAERPLRAISLDSVPLSFNREPMQLTVFPKTWEPEPDTTSDEKEKEHAESPTQDKCVE